MTLKIRKATRTQAKARIGLIGPSGSGKTYTALAVGKHLGSTLVVIDTERSSSELYAGEVADFEVIPMETHDPRIFVEALDLAAEHGADVVIIDSLSHAWMGRDGALEQVDKAAKRSKGNSFAAWRDVTPMHHALIDAILTYPGHVIATMRSKTEYVLEDNNGRKVPRKVGMAPVQRDGMEYEFSIVGDLDHDHNLVITKSRCSALADAVINKPGKDFARKIRTWLDAGDVPAEDDPALPLLAGVQSKDALREWAVGHALAYDELTGTDRDRARMELMRAGKRVGAEPKDIATWLDLGRTANTAAEVFNLSNEGGE